MMMMMISFWPPPDDIVFPYDTLQAVARHCIVVHIGYYNHPVSPHPKYAGGFTIRFLY